MVFGSSKKTCILKTSHHEIAYNPKNWQKFSNNWQKWWKIHEKSTYRQGFWSKSVHLKCFRPNSNLHICKVHAPRGRVSRGLVLIPICTYVSHKANKKVLLCWCDTSPKKALKEWSKKTKGKEWQPKILYIVWFASK